MPSQLLLVALAVCAAFVVESALGFGATVVAVALGAQLMPLASLLPAFVTLNLGLSAYLCLRYRRDVDRAVLFGRVLPWMLAGMPLGMLLVRRLGESTLKRAFGAFVVALAAAELARFARRGGDAKPLPRPLAAALLALAGVVHGMFATGGPLTVYVAGRLVGDKARFRATLSALWLALNAVLFAGYVREGAVGRASLGLTATLLPALGLGVVLGELAHRRAPERAFRAGVYCMLLAAGGALVARG